MAGRLGRVAGGRWPVQPQAASCFVRRENSGQWSVASECEAGEIAVMEKRQDRHQLFFGHCWLLELPFSLLFSTSRGRGLRGTVPVPLFARGFVSIR